MIRRSIPIAFAALAPMLFAGCALKFKENAKVLMAQSRIEDYGYPPPDDYRKIQEEHIASTLKDPYSAQYQHSDPVTFVIPSQSFSSEPALVWMTTTKVNAKNSYGGYTGWHEYRFAWADGAIRAVATPYSGPSPDFWEYPRGGIAPKKRARPYPPIRKNPSDSSESSESSDAPKL